MNYSNAVNFQETLSYAIHLANKESREVYLKQDGDARWFVIREGLQPSALKVDTEGNVSLVNSWINIKGA